MAVFTTARLGLDLNPNVSTLFLTSTGVLLFTLLVRRIFTVLLDEDEPPALYPRIPIVGHLIGLITKGGTFFATLSTQTHLPAASLPILNGKMYTIFDPHLLQGAFRNRILTVKPYMVKFLKAEVSYPSKYDDLVQTSTFMDDTIKCLHSSMTAQNIYRMNVNALQYLGNVLNALPKDGEMDISNLWLWVRDELTVATCEALYGTHNPFKSGSSLVDDLWTFEAKLSNFLLGLAPSITAPAAYKARSRLQAALKEYHSNSYDTDEHAANLVSECAQIIRQHGIAPEDAGYFGIPILHVSTANSIPVAYWFFAEVFSRPDLVQELREECEGAVAWAENEKVAIVNLDVLAEKCPLLYSCYRETIRTNNQTPISRRVTATTTITDNKGTTYTLKADTDLQCSMGALHRNTSVWGDDATLFNPYRFLKMDAEPASQSKTRRASFVPFGGGQHLCPGRTFAQAENLGFVLALVLGFDVSPMQRGNGWDKVVLPEKMPLNLGQALHKPLDEGGFGVRIGKRSGWEDVLWKFVSGSREV